jgi:phosphopantetheinyl transferase (holo-ACP synthase)
MDTQFKNLFPTAIWKGAVEIFGEQSIQPVLLRLMSINTVTEHCKSDSLFLEMLHPKEAAILSGYKFPKRQSEYLTGRICAKLAVQELFNLTKPHSNLLILPEIEIANTANGRPNVCLHGENIDTFRMDISISHSGDYGVALAAVSKCGIDLQWQNAALLRVQEKYCNEREYRLLETNLTDRDTITKLTLLWAAKEAAKKALSQWQMPGFLDMEMWKLKKITNCVALFFRLTKTKSQQMPKEVTVLAGMFGDYALAVCLVSEDIEYA